MQKFLKSMVSTVLVTGIALSAIVPMAYSETAEEVSFESSIESAQLLTPMLEEFEVGNNDFVATSVVNGHDYLYVPHNSKLFVYDLDTFEKVDEEVIDMPETDGALVDSDGIVWVYGQTSVFYRYDPVQQTGYKTAPFRGNTNTSKTHVYYPIEVDGKLYAGTYNEGRLVEYTTPVMLWDYIVSGNTFTDLNILVEGGIKMTTIAHKDGYLYASVHAATFAQEPHVLIKYDLSAKQVVGSLDLKAAGALTKSAYLTQSVIVGDVFLGATANRDNMLAVDINTMQTVDIGCTSGIVHGFSQVITEDDGNEKVYFQVRGSKGLDLYEYNSNTKAATAVEGFDSSTAQFNTRGNSFVTIEAEGLSGQSMLVGMKTDGTLALYNMETGAMVELAGLSAQDKAAMKSVDFRGGPAGSNEIYVGSFMSNIAAVYDIQTNSITKKYPAYSEQVETSIWFDDTWYVTGYGACSISEMNYETGEYNVLFALNETDKLNLVQERIHTVAAGDNKVFGATVPHKNILGGFIAWYDYDQQATFVAVEADKVIYQPDTDKSQWLDAKTGEAIVFNTDDNGANDFTGVIENQLVNSLHYCNGYLYGTTYIGGGSGSTPADDSTAQLFVYDVENMKLVKSQPISQMIQGLASPVELVSAFVPDPDVAGKFWGVVAQTLFTATYDHSTNTFCVEEKVSYGKDSYRAYISKYKSGQIYFKNGYAILNFRGSNPERPEANDTVDNLRIINMANPKISYVLSTQSMGGYVLGEDNNIYYLKDNGVSVLYTAEVIEEITKVDRAPVEAVEKLIDGIGAEITKDSEAQLVAIRTAYEELTDEQKSLVTNYAVLTAAEKVFMQLMQADAETIQYVFTNNKTIKVRTEGDGGTYVEPNFDGLSIPEENGNWTFVGRYLSGKTGTADGTRVNISNDSLTTYFTENALSSSNGDWIALQLSAVPAGTYQMKFTAYTAGGTSNNGKSDVFMIPASEYSGVYADYMSLTAENAQTVRDKVNNGMKTLLSNKTAVGVFDSTVAEVQTVGEYTCQADGDYVLVFRCTANQTGNCRLSLASLDMTRKYELPSNETVAKIGGQTYTSLKQAMEEAKPGETVRIENVAATGSLDVPAGVVLDLNGFTVITNEVFTAGDIVDSSQKDTGVLKASDIIYLGEANSQLPLYDSAAEGYRFFEIAVESVAVTGKKSDFRKYWFKLNIENMETVLELIDNGDSGLSIGVDLLWDGQEHPVSAAASAEFVALWAAKAKENPNIYITVSVTDIAEDMTNFQLIPVISANGVNDTGDILC